MKRGDIKSGNLKYSDDGAFNDPVVRCYECNKIVKLETVKTIGRCEHCGARKIKKMHNMNGDELNQMVEWGIDPDFLALFAPVEEVGNG